MPTLGKRLRSLRRSANMTLAQVADGASLSVSYIADLEHDRCVPRLDALVRIASVFEVDAVSVLAGIEPFDRSSGVDRP